MLKKFLGLFLFFTIIYASFSFIQAEIADQAIDTFIAHLTKLETSVKKSTCNAVHKKMPIERVKVLLSDALHLEEQSLLPFESKGVLEYVKNMNEDLDSYETYMQENKYILARTEDLYDFKKKTEECLDKIIETQESLKRNTHTKKYLHILYRLKQSLVDHVFDEEMIGFNGFLEKVLFHVGYKTEYYIRKNKRTVGLALATLLTGCTAWKLRKRLSFDTSITNRTTSSHSQGSITHNLPQGQNVPQEQPDKPDNQPINTHPSDKPTGNSTPQVQDSPSTPTKPKFDTLKSSYKTSLQQGDEGVANCAVYSAFHMEHFLKERKNHSIGDPKREDWKPFWERYIQWVNDPDTKKRCSPGTAGGGNDFTGSFVDKGTISTFFRERNSSTDAHVYITGYNVGDGSELQQITSDKDMTLLKITAEDTDETFNYRQFVIDWYRLFNDPDHAEPIYYIVSNGGHFIAIKYYIKDGTVQADFRDSAGQSISIVNHCYNMIKELQDNGWLMEYYNASIPPYKIMYDINDVSTIDYIGLQSVDLKNYFQDVIKRIYCEEKYIEMSLIFYNKSNQQEDHVKIIIDPNSLTKEPIFITDREDATDINAQTGYVWKDEIKKRLLDCYRSVVAEMKQDYPSFFS